MIPLSGELHYGSGYLSKHRVHASLECLLIPYSTHTHIILCVLLVLGIFVSIAILKIDDDIENDIFWILQLSIPQNHQLIFHNDTILCPSSTPLQ